jgi:hypothetical protein
MQYQAANKAINTTLPLNARGSLNRFCMGLQANQHKAYLLMKWYLKLGDWLGFIWGDLVRYSAKTSSITNTVVHCVVLPMRFFIFVIGLRNDL